MISSICFPLIKRFRLLGLTHILTKCKVSKKLPLFDPIIEFILGFSNENGVIFPRLNRSDILQ